MEFWEIVTLSLAMLIALYFSLALYGELFIEKQYIKRVIELSERAEYRYKELLAAKEVEIFEKDKLIEAQMEYIKKLEGE